MGVSKRWVGLLCFVVLLGCAPGTVAQETPPPTAAPERAMWLDISMGPALIEWFNDNALPQDIARADRVQQAPVLNGITAGRRLLVFKSAVEAAEMMPLWKDQVDIIGYNIESGPVSPQGEQADPIAGIRIMRELADEYGVGLAVGPDRYFALNYGTAMAPYVDMFVIQIQRIQTEPETVRAYVLPLAEMLRQANPDIQISVQVRTEGDTDRLVDLVRSLGNSIDGVSILTSVSTVDVAEELVRKLHHAYPATETPTPLAGLRVAEAAEATPGRADGAAGAASPPLQASPVAPSATPTPEPPPQSTSTPLPTAATESGQAVAAALATATPVRSTATPDLVVALAGSGAGDQAAVAEPSGTHLPWMLVTLGVVAAGIAGVLALMLARPRSPASRDHD